MEEKKECKYCQGTKGLDQKGIRGVYLWPCWFSAGLTITGIILGIFLRPAWFFLAGAGFIIPVVNADLRLTLYPVVVVSAILGKKIKCPKC